MDVVTLPAHNPGPWTGAGNNTYLLLGRSPTLIDAGVGAPRHLDELAAALEAGGGLPLAQVLVTHGHVDHASGVAALARRWPHAAFRKMPWPEQDRRHPVEWHPLGDGERVRAGDRALMVIHTPGHAPDHVCLLETESGTLFCGDLAIAGGTVVIPASRGGRLTDYLASLERVRALGVRRLLAGHGPPIDDPDTLLADYIAHRHRREREILAALDGTAGVDADALVRQVYGRLPDGVVGAARETVLAHLAKLESEGRVRSSGGQWSLVGPGGGRP